MKPAREFLPLGDDFPEPHTGLAWAQIGFAALTGLCGCAALLAFFDVLTP